MEVHDGATYVSATKFHNRHTGDYPVNIVEKMNIPIASVGNPRIKILRAGGRSWGAGGFKVKWGRDVEDTRDRQKEGKLIWFGTISPGKEALVSEWDVREPVDTGWSVELE